MELIRYWRILRRWARLIILLPILAGVVAGITSLLLYGACWLGGTLGQIGTALGNQTLTHVGTVTSLILPTEELWRGALFYLQPAAFTAASLSGRAALANAPFVSSQPPTFAFHVWTLLWLIAVLWGAAFSFARREV